MKRSPPPRASGSRPPDSPPPPEVVLRLYVTGSTPRSARAVADIKRFCEKHLASYDLEVIDMYQQPERLRDDDVIAAPTLVKRTPAPSRRIVGGLSDEKTVLSALQLPT